MRPDETMLNGTTDTAALENALTSALEKRPEAHVPADFAARVMNRLPDEQPGKVLSDRKGLGVARTVGYLSAAATTAALAAIALWNPAAVETGKTVAFAVEMLLLAELLGVGLWLGTRRDA